MLWEDQIQRATHITAIAADTPGKYGLDPAILAKADLVLAGSISQCVESVEIAQAMRGGAIEKEDMLRLDYVIGVKRQAKRPTIESPWRK